MKYVWKLITSYPMKCIDRFLFVDKVSNKSVGLYEDKHGRKWLAESAWSAFRVPSK